MEKEEKERKLREEERRNRRLKEIQDESFQCSRNMAAIEMKWSEMREIEECEELKKEIEEQGKLFQEVRDGKNNLTNKFQEELKKKEDEYSKMLRRQARDISVTIEKMRG
jgi:dynein regulatory complex protein 1